MNPNSTMGSVISGRELDRIEGMVGRTRGRVLEGGERMSGVSELDGFDFSGGSFFPPTVVTDVGVEDELWREEVFGPVVVVKRFTVRYAPCFPLSSLFASDSDILKDEAEGVALANASQYGLGAGIWTTDLSRGHRVAAGIDAGICWVNTHHRNDPSSPWCVRSLTSHCVFS